MATTDSAVPVRASLPESLSPPTATPHAAHAREPAPAIDPRPFTGLFNRTEERDA